MTTDLLLVQLLVLCATGVFFWLARRDLRSRTPSSPPVPADTRELEQLCVTLEALVTELSRRLDRLERRFAQSANAPSPAADAVRPAEEGAASSAPTGRPEEAAAYPDNRYAALYALLDAGETDPQEITRRVGLSRGEVDLILSLRERHAL